MQRILNGRFLISGSGIEGWLTFPSNGGREARTAVPPAPTFPAYYFNAPSTSLSIFRIAKKHAVFVEDRIIDADVAASPAQIPPVAFE